MDITPAAPAQETPITDLFRQDEMPAGREGQAAAAGLALSQQANQIGMTGLRGEVERVAIVAGDGIGKTPMSMVNAVEKKGIGKVAEGVAEYGAVGAALSIIAPQDTLPGALAFFWVTGSIVAREAPAYHEAMDQGLRAKTWSEMDQASTTFGQATAPLAFYALGFGLGTKLGSVAADKTGMSELAIFSRLPGKP